MSRNIVFLKGSPSTASRSGLIADAVAAEVARAGAVPAVWSLNDFDPGDIVFGRIQAPAIARFVEATRSAAALVLATPVYKASYSGALKAVVDLIPPDALLDRPLLGIATARLPAHSADVDRSFRALAAFFKARALETLVVLDGDAQLDASTGRLPENTDQRARQAARIVVTAVAEAASAGVSP